MKNDRPGITATAAATAVIRMGKLIPFFSADPYAREMLAVSLVDFIGSPDELDWLVKLAANVMPEWKGLSELRGLYCTRFRPLDGIEAVSGTTGYTPAELADKSERDFFEREARETDQRLGEYRAAFRHLPAEEQQANRKLLEAASATELKRV